MIVVEEGYYFNGVYMICLGVVRMSYKYYNGYCMIGYLINGYVFGFEEIW